MKTLIFTVLIKITTLEMKDLYICIFQKFNLSLQDVNIFDYNKQDEASTNKLQAAYSYYKSHSRDEKLMFMQFCRNLYKHAEAHSALLNKQLIDEQREVARPFVFICIYNLSIMIVEHKAEQLFSFICINSSNGQKAVNEYCDIMASGYSINIDKERCAFFGDCRMVMGENHSTDCGVYFYPLTLGEFKILESSRDDTVFKNVNEPILMLNNQYICVSPFISTINTYIKDRTASIVRKKSESAPAKTNSNEIVPEEEKDAMTIRFREFEQELDNILKKYKLD